MHVLDTGEASICVPTAMGRDTPKKEIVKTEKGWSLLKKTMSLGRLAAAATNEPKPSASAAGASSPRRGSLSHLNSLKWANKKDKSSPSPPQQIDTSSPRGSVVKQEYLRPIHRLFKSGEIFGEGGVFEHHAGDLAVVANTVIKTLWISKAHFVECVPHMARDMIEGECAYRMEMVDTLNMHARNRLSSTEYNDDKLLSERLSVYGDKQKAVGSFKNNARSSSMRSLTRSRSCLVFPTPANDAEHEIQQGRISSPHRSKVDDGG